MNETLDIVLKRMRDSVSELQSFYHMPIAVENKNSRQLHEAVVYLQAGIETIERIQYRITHE